MDGRLHFEEEDGLRGVAAAAWPRAVAIDERGEADPVETERLPWNAPGYAMPVTQSQVRSGEQRGLRLQGEVKVTIRLLDAPGHPLSSEARVQAIAEVQAALQFLSTVEVNARLTFHARLQQRTLESSSQTPPAPPAPEDLLRQERLTDGSLLVVLTAFPLHPFALATPDGLVLSLDGGPWGPRNVHRLLVHLLVTAAGATPDPGPQVRPGDRAECITKTNSLRLCQRARRQVGWTSPDLPFPLLLCHRGRHDDSLWFCTGEGTSARPQSWSLDVQLPWHRSTIGPALAVFGGRWIAVYRLQSPEDSGNLRWAVFDGARWTEDRPVGAGPGNSVSSARYALSGRCALSGRHTPGLAAFEGALHCVEGDDEGRLRHCIFDGESWSAPRALPNRCAAGPTLASFQNRLWCLHPGGDGDRLHCATFDGRAWSGDRPLPHSGHRCEERPALAVLASGAEERLVAAFRSPEGGKVLWTECDGETWFPPQDTGWISASAPALCPLEGGQVLLAGTAAEDDHVWLARRTEAGWEKPVHLLYHKARRGVALAARPAAYTTSTSR